MGWWQEGSMNMQIPKNLKLPTYRICMSHAISILLPIKNSKQILAHSDDI